MNPSIRKVVLVLTVIGAVALAIGLPLLVILAMMKK